MPTTCTYTQVSVLFRSSVSTPLSSLKPIGHTWSYMACRTGHLVPHSTAINRTLISLMVYNHSCGYGWWSSLKQMGLVPSSGMHNGTFAPYFATIYVGHPMKPAKKQFLVKSDWACFVVTPSKQMWLTTVLALSGTQLAWLPCVRRCPLLHTK
jgi:hypothetical protein